jgi:hypothetical protein
MNSYNIRLFAFSDCFQLNSNCTPLLSTLGIKKFKLWQDSKCIVYHGKVINEILICSCLPKNIITSHGQWKTGAKVFTVIQKRRSRRPRKGQLRTLHPHTNERGFQASWQWVPHTHTHIYIYIYTIQSFCAYIINNKIDEEHKASKKILLNMHMAMNQSTNKFF